VQAAGRGLCSAALVLTRLDAVFLVGALSVATCTEAVGAARRRGESRAVWSAASFFASWAVPLGGYLALNRLQFGTWLPISGMIKSTFPHIQIASEISALIATKGAVPLVIVGLYLLSGFHRSTGHQATTQVWACVGVIGYFAYLGLFTRDFGWSVAAWYFTWPTVVASFVMLCAGESWEWRRPLARDRLARSDGWAGMVEARCKRGRCPGGFVSGR